MEIREAQGYTKLSALESTGLNVSLDRLKNATLAWKKAGSPIGNKALKEFMQNYVKDRKVIGAYIVVDNSSSDTRKRPYSIINEVTYSKRKTALTYQVKEATLDVKFHPEKKVVVDKETGEETTVETLSPYKTINVEVEVVDKETKEKSLVTKAVQVPDVKVNEVGAVSAKHSKKEDAFAAMRELIEANKRDYLVEIVKEVSNGQKYAGYGLYTPSKSAKMGKFMFFVQE